MRPSSWAARGTTSSVDLTVIMTVRIARCSPSTSVSIRLSEVWIAISSTSRHCSSDCLLSARAGSAASFFGEHREADACRCLLGRGQTGPVPSRCTVARYNRACWPLRACVGAQSWTAWWGRGHAQASQLDSQHARNTNALPNPDLCIHTVLADLQGGVLRAECGVDRRVSRVLPCVQWLFPRLTLPLSFSFQLSRFQLSATSSATACWLRCENFKG
mmetsp:Transcript_14775/g.33133  ORF Transcript_14775/g.33133 Transcript_14775/m.33133 type:complete len:217 (-) Transcript_14775:110-760(-)